MLTQEAQKRVSVGVQPCVSEGQFDFREVEVFAEHLGEVMKTHGTGDVVAEAQEVGRPAADR